VKNLSDGDKTDKILRFTQDGKQPVILNEVKKLGVGN